MNLEAGFSSLSAACCHYMITVKYSTTDETINWCRRLRIKLIVSLKPFLNVEAIAISKTEKSGWSRFNIAVENHCYEEISLVSSCLKKDSFLLSSHSNEDVFVEEGNLLNVTTLVPEEEALVKLDVRNISQDDAFPEYNDDKPDDWICQKAKECLNRALGFQWRVALSGNEQMRRGMVEVNFHQLTSEDILQVIQPPVDWELFIDDKNVSERLLHSSCLADSLHLRVTTTNTTRKSISMLNLHLEIYQDQLNGQLEWNIDECALIVGSRQQEFLNVQPSCSVSFECVLIFLLAGEYNIRVRKNSTNVIEDRFKMMQSNNNANSSAGQLLRNVSPVVKINVHSPDVNEN